MNLRRLFVGVTLILAGAGCRAATDQQQPDRAEAGEGSGEVSGEVVAVDAPTVLTADGWGRLSIGMTRQEVVENAGADEMHPRPPPVAMGECEVFHPADSPPGMRVMIEQGRLTRITVGADSPVKTVEGFGPGDSAEEVASRYGDRAIRSLHKYVGPPAEYITVWKTGPERENARGIVYEIGEDGRVLQVHAGGPSIQYVEGCG